MTKRERGIEDLLPLESPLPPTPFLKFHIFPVNFILEKRVTRNNRLDRSGQVE